MIKNSLYNFALGCIVSLYFFPIGFTFLPEGINSKMILAVIGVIWFFFGCIRDRSLIVPKDIVWATVIAALFSLSCFLSITVNNTDDTSYAGYMVSFFTWLLGAFAVCSILRLKYGTVSLGLLSKYLAWVGVGQGVSMLMIDNIPAFSAFVDMFMDIGQAHVRELNRLYGIGSALDPAGVRFSIILILLSHYLCTVVIPKKDSRLTALYVFAYLFIVLTGNMISRTTSVGALMGLAYLFLFLFRIDRRGEIRRGKSKAFIAFLVVLAVAAVVFIYLYNYTSLHDNIRFAFEGFFNWVETGEWRTDSTDKLNGEMWVWPKDNRSWIIGTGLFEGFVYSTDVGYCRFILYCGLLGFSLFSFFFVYNSVAFSQKFRNTAFLAIMLLALSFILWIKVATDIFMIYALLYCADPLTGDYEAKSV